MTTLLLATASAYLLGSVPFALLLGKLGGVDIRGVGSGNVGATNLTRALGRRWGVAAFLLDFLKGLAPVVAGALLLTPPLYGGGTPGPIPLPSLVQARILLGVAAVLGHVFPVFLGFRGGKGVATSFGVIAGLLPLAALAAGAAWILAFYVRRVVSIASLVAVVVFPAGTVLFYRDLPEEDFYTLLALTLALAALVVVRHRENIARLLKGRENRF